MSLTKTRAWIAGTVVLCLLLTVAAWFLLISPKRAEAAEVREQVTAEQSKNEQTRARIAELKEEAKKLPQREAELASLRQAMPVDDELAALTRTLNGYSQSSGAALDVISPAEPVAVTPAGAPAAAATPAPAGTEAAGTTGTAAAPAATSGLVRVPVTVVVTGNYQKSLAFLKSMQADMTRNYLVSGIQVGEPQLASNVAEDVAKREGWVTMTVTGSVFALPNTPAAPAAAAPAAAEPAAAAN